MINELKNKYNIYKLVKNHFSLSPNSLKTFKYHLFEQPVIPHTFKHILTEKNNYRYEIPLTDFFNLDDNNLQQLFPVYNYFCTNFYDIITEYNLNFFNFDSNKFTFNKQTHKLIKFIFKLKLLKLLNITELDPLKTNVKQIIRDYKDKLENEKFQNELNTLNSELKYIIQNKTSSNIKLFLSKNFTDFFMCSTNQSFRSCLDLDSEYESCYWKGLPGTIVDPNRFLVFITNDKIQEPYYNIATYKFITRCWLLLTEKTHIFHLVKPYPNNNFLEFILQNLRKTFPKKTITTHTESEFFKTSKHSFKPLFNKELNSLYIYQDTTRFKITSKDKVKLLFGGKGYECLNDNLSFIDENVNYTNGLSGLISNNEEILDHQSCDVCCCCGSDENVEFYSEIDDYYCNDCFNERFTFCNCCDSILDVNREVYYDEKGFPYCEECYNDKYDRCQCCDTEINLKHDSYQIIEDEVYCEECFSEKFFICDKCNEIFPIDEMNSHNDNVYCNNCYQEKLGENNE